MSMTCREAPYRPLDSPQFHLHWERVPGLGMLRYCVAPPSLHTSFLLARVPNGRLRYQRWDEGLAVNRS